MFIVTFAQYNPQDGDLYHDVSCVCESLEEAVTYCEEQIQDTVNYYGKEAVREVEQIVPNKRLVTTTGGLVLSYRIEEI